MDDEEDQDTSNINENLNSVVTASSNTEATNNTELDNITKIAFTFGKCKICSDKATGIHYGISTCEGCKGFYKRSLDKYISYFCFNNNKCVINKITRNRCKSCRFKKCMKEGMSIDGIRMGRIPNSEKVKGLKSTPGNEDELEEEEDDSINDREDDSQKKLDSINEEIKRKEFKDWLNYQLNYVLKNDIQKINKDLKKNNFIKLVLEVYVDSTFECNLKPFDFIKQNNFFGSLNVLPNSLFNGEISLFYITFLKDHCYQIYKKQIQECKLIQNTNERLKTKDYIDSNDPNVNREQIFYGVANSIGEFTKWLTIYIRQMPGFNTLNVTDFSTIIKGGVLLCYATHVNRFVVNNECFAIVHNNIQSSKSRLRTLFGTNLCELFFEYHSRLNRLKFLDQETCLFYLFIVTCFNIDLIQEKERFLFIKNFYTKTLIYQLELKRRDEKFYRRLKECFDVAKVMELNKEQFWINSI